ncbi:GNAT family N-acetyltransferase [Sinomicrobium weinanense]|uniref:GNAT family N-acetyltransferase n=1 Tax=Sinomicrobium weinanense TaxID=2842200 RepID=A0A926JP46_9FLAO|nr:GNAT family N-acetyltransferase [Sinomicrobium weinanense]MBC9794895.1 GNAT family N-acetyltransferase [Sinomicrobium weinanense]MBU3125666.1 GNAT family N-acetyltransferase [Sinomicrobium weinanense]
MKATGFYIREIPGHFTWPLRQKVMYPGQSVESVILEDDARGTHFGLYSADDELRSVISLFYREDGRYQFRKFATDTTQQGKGYGSALLSYTIDFCRKEKGRTLWCNARKSASSFYKRYHFTETNTTFFKKGHDYVIMELPLYL